MVSKACRNITKSNPKIWLCLFLLSLYTVGLIPTFLIHHHDKNIVSYSKADACERVIFYGAPSSLCHHKEHLSKELPKCWICAIHTIPQLIVHPEIRIWETQIKIPFLSENYCKPPIIPVLRHFKRGPPSFALFDV